MHKGEMMYALGKWTDFFGWIDFSVVPVEALIRGAIALGSAILLWFLISFLYRQLHKAMETGPAARLLHRSPESQTPYKTSFWGSLEAPTKFLIVVITLSYLAALLAPNTVASQYLGEIWRAAIIVSLVWFLLRWKSNSISQLLSDLTLSNDEKEQYLTLDKLSSVAILLLAGMAFAETCGVPLQSVATIGGLGSIVIAYAAKDVLGNILSGFSLQFTKPFSIGDTISADSVEGQVVTIGLISTHLLNGENYPTIVPNSFFSSQKIESWNVEIEAIVLIDASFTIGGVASLMEKVVVNKSRAKCRALTVEIPIQLKDYEKISKITVAIEGMLKNHPKVFAGNIAPRCFISQINATSVDVTISCDLNLMGKEEYWSTKQDILVDAMQIVSSTGATLGAPYSSR